MTVKHTIAPVILALSIALVVLVNFSCKKSSSTTAVIASQNSSIYIDSIAGYYAGTTSGDSVYTYIDSTGKPAQWVHSFSLPDTIFVSSPDSISIHVSSKYFAAVLPYGDSLTITSVDINTDIASVSTMLQNTVLGQFTSFNDTASSINHIILNVGNSGAKSFQSSVYLYNRSQR
jgi:hypothetical protein